MIQNVLRHKPASAENVRTLAYLSSVVLMQNVRFEIIDPNARVYLVTKEIHMIDVGSTSALQILTVLPH